MYLILHMYAQIINSSILEWIVDDELTEKKECICNG